MKTGILGGTFDPVHVGHVAVAASVHAALALDRTLLVVAGEPWQKGDVVAPARLRYEMAAAAAADLDTPGIAASDIEIGRAGPTYTVDTVEALLDSPGERSELYLVIGHDVALTIDSWHRVEDLKRLVTLAVVSRPGVSGEVCLPGWKVRAVEAPQLAVSSTTVRRRLAAGLPVDGLVPAAAMRILRASDGYPEGR